MTSLVGLRIVNTPAPEAGSKSYVGYGCAIRLSESDSLGQQMEVVVIGLTPDQAAIACEYLSGATMDLEKIRPVLITQTQNGMIP